MFIFHDGKKPACFLHAGFFQRFYDIYKSKQGSYLDILCAYLQNDFIQQISHFGFRASQTALPCNTIRWQKSLDSSGGSSLRKSSSTFTGTLLFVRPSLPQIRIKWVSVTTAGFPYTSPKIKLAVFLPTPGRERRSSILSGTIPLNSSFSFSHCKNIACLCFKQTAGTNIFCNFFFRAVNKIVYCWKTFKQCRRYHIHSGIRTLCG